MSIHTLYEGSYSIDASKQFVPFDPLTDNPKDRPGSFFISVQPFLLKTKKGLVLIDAGLGLKNNHNELILHQNIRNVGYDPADVTLVLLSHLHHDHIGGLVMENKSNGQLEPSFPNAMHVIQREEWTMALSGLASSYDKSKSICEVLQKNHEQSKSGILHLVTGKGVLQKQGIKYELSGGHCQFHQVFFIQVEQEKYFFGGDELSNSEHLMKKFAAKYDYDGKRAMQLRKEYGIKAAEENSICLFYHDLHHAMARVNYSRGIFSIDTSSL